MSSNQLIRFFFAIQFYPKTLERNITFGWGKKRILSLNSSYRNDKKNRVTWSYWWNENNDDKKGIKCFSHQKVKFFSNLSLLSSYIKIHYFLLLLFKIHSCFRLKFCSWAEKTENKWKRWSSIFNHQHSATRKKSTYRLYKFVRSI